MDIGDGWAVDEADPDVGIFNNFVYHEDCKKWDEENDRPAHVEHDTVITSARVLGVVDIADVFTCACGATKIMTTQEPAEDFEEVRDTPEVEYNG